MSGLVLFISLAILLLLSIVGLASVQVANLQVRMAGNAHNNLLAFYAAEHALREAEAFLSHGVPQPSMYTSPGIGGLWRSASYGQPAPWMLSGVWDSAGNGSRPVERSPEGVAAPPRYLIEWLTTFDVGDDPHLAEAPPSTPPPRIAAFRVTARGVGATVNAQAVLQSTFARRLPPSG